MSPSARCTVCRTTYRSATAHLTTASHRDKAYRLANPTGVALAAERAESARVRRLGSQDAYAEYLAAESLRDNGTAEDPPYVLALAIAAGIGIPPEPAEGTAYFDAVADEPRIVYGSPVLTLREAAERLGVSSTTLRVQVRNGKLHAESRQEARGPVWYVSEAECARYAAESKGRQSVAGAAGNGGRPAGAKDRVPRKRASARA